MCRPDAWRAALAAILLLMAAAARAGGSIAGATEPTQIMNNLQLVKVAMDGAQTAQTVVNQYLTQLQQYEAQMLNTLKLPQLPAGFVSDGLRAYNELARYKGALDALQGSLGQQQAFIEQRIAEARLGGGDWKAYLARVAADVSRNQQRAVERLKYEDSVLRQVQSDYTFARDLQSQIPATVGQHQALQLLNAQMNRVVTQNAKLLEVMSATIAERAEREVREAEGASRLAAEVESMRRREEELSERLRSFGGIR